MMNSGLKRAAAVKLPQTFLQYFRSGILLPLPDSISIRQRQSWPLYLFVIWEQVSSSELVLLYLGFTKSSKYFCGFLWSSSVCLSQFFTFSLEGNQATFSLVLTLGRSPLLVRMSCLYHITIYFFPYKNILWLYKLFSSVFWKHCYW